MSQSKLFKVVREKNSLCYYISSSYDAFNGVMVITAGIEGKDYHQTVQLIKEQLKEMHPPAKPIECFAVSESELIAIGKIND